jgi:hypothetical protein
VEIDETAPTETAPSGFTFLGQQVNITAPAATVRKPLILMFNLHSSIAGTDPNAVEIFKAAVLVEVCAGMGATPDPCVESRALVGDNIQIVVRTSTASPWNFGTLPEPGAILQLVAGGIGLAFLNKRRLRMKRRSTEPTNPAHGP